MDRERKSKEREVEKGEGGRKGRREKSLLYCLLRIVSESEALPTPFSSVTYSISSCSVAMPLQLYVCPLSMSILTGIILSIASYWLGPVFAVPLTVMRSSVEFLTSDISSSVHTTITLRPTSTDVGTVTVHLSESGSPVTRNPKGSCVITTDGGGTVYKAQGD